MQSIARWVTSLLILAGLALAPSTSWAGDPALSNPKDTKALAHLNQGNSLYYVRKFEEAAAEYIAGTIVERAPVFDYNLGQCYRQLGKYKDAIWHYERFLLNGKPATTLRGHVEGFIRQMKSELAKQAMTQPPTEPAPGTEEPQPSAEVRTASVVDPADPGPAWYTDRFGWGLAGAGVAGGVTAGLLFLSASSLRDEANASAREEERIELRDRADTRVVVGAVVGATGLALILTGAFKLAIHSSPSAQSGTVALGFGVSPRGFTLSGRF